MVLLAAGDPFLPHHAQCSMHALLALADPQSEPGQSWAVAPVWLAVTPDRNSLDAESSTATPYGDLIGDLMDGPSPAPASNGAPCKLFGPLLLGHAHVRAAT